MTTWTLDMYNKKLNKFIAKRSLLYLVPLLSGMNNYNWLYHIPVDVSKRIFEYCDNEALLIMSFVSHTLRRIISTPNCKLNLCDYGALHNN